MDIGNGKEEYELNIETKNMKKGKWGAPGAVSCVKHKNEMHI